MLALAAFLALSLQAEEAAVLTSLIAAEIGKEPTLDVASAADVRRVLELEGDKQTIGCDESASCLAEIAGALGARYVVISDVGQLGQSMVLTVTVWDSRTGQTVVRRLFKGGNVDDVSAKLEGSAANITTEILSSRGAAAAGVRTKVVVLDVRGSGTTSAKAAASVDGDPSATSLDGALPAGIVLGVGALAALGGTGTALWAASVINDVTRIADGGPRGEDKQTAQVAGLVGVGVAGVGVAGVVVGTSLLLVGGE